MFRNPSVEFTPPEQLVIRRPLPKNPADVAAFNELNSNGDRVVDAEEAQQAGWTNDRFEAFDTYNKGRLTRQTFLDGMRFEREFNKRDRNGDGELGKGEFRGGAERKISLKELPEHLGGGISKAMHALTQKLPQRQPKAPAAASRLESFDKNGDNKISKKEYIAGRREESPSSPPSGWLPLPPQGRLRPEPLPLPLPPRGRLRPEPLPGGTEHYPGIGRLPANPNPNERPKIRHLPNETRLDEQSRIKPMGSS